MKNLLIRSQTLAQIKANALDAMGDDLTVSSVLMSDLVTDPDEFLSEDYPTDPKSFVVDGSTLS